MWQVHCRKLTASRKTMLVNVASVVVEEGAGDGVHQHRGATFLEVLLVKIFSRLIKIGG